MTLTAIHTSASPSATRPAATDDPLLDALVQARQRIEQATLEMRILLALGREFTAPRPYTLKQLAQAAGLSLSGVRTAYGPRELAYLQLVLSGGQMVPSFLRGPVTALRHRPSPELDDGHQ
ncbi:hypothetical protein [Actinomadura rupiterrae]|uniref:hypothetical protein n=1 Tax=Actinomadura rupiterrae TaxID=559627 RepID=UPI0020A2370B|nr:hypothetical protein [Actinomadura rupiterrae]MCP2341021.1 hypothetical protein [Actinomadura rupiterrae]